jgi:hypothetical protein
VIEMAKKYLDDIGLAHLWDKIKAKITSSISDEAGKMIPYGYCTTASKTVAKAVTVSPAVTELETGLTIAVKFQYANGVANPTLNVNGTGAKAIKRYGTTAPSTSATSSWNALSVIVLTYDGTYWQIADWNNTTYSGMTDAEYQAGTSATNRLITPARLKSAIELWCDKNVQSDWDETDTESDAYIKNKPTIPSYGNATQSQAGLMSAIDKQKLDALLAITQDSESGEVTIGTRASQNTSGEVTI